MTDLVPATDIERIVGADRHPTAHLGRAISAEQRVYILHSHECLRNAAALGQDLRECPYSIALDQGLIVEDWADHQDQVIGLSIDTGALMPAPLPHTLPPAANAPVDPKDVWIL